MYIYNLYFLDRHNCILCSMRCQKFALKILWKRSVFIPISKKGSAKECLNYCTIALISQTIKVMSKVLRARLQQYVKWELSDVQSGFRKGRGTRDQIANVCWIIGKQGNSRKASTSTSLTTLKILCGSQQTVENS